MRTSIVLLLAASLAITACGPRAPSADSGSGPGPALGALPTSPAGIGAQAAGGIPARLIYRAREFRGNPLPLAVLTGAALLGALALGLYTLRVAYRRPPDDTAP
jgi:hypothetical protein